MVSHAASPELESEGLCKFLSEALTEVSVVPSFTKLDEDIVVSNLLPLDARRQLCPRASCLARDLPATQSDLSGVHERDTENGEKQRGPCGKPEADLSASEGQPYGCHHSWVEELNELQEHKRQCLRLR